MKLYRILALSSAAVIAFSGCSDTEEISAGIPTVTKLAADNINKRESVVVYGENFTANGTTPRVFLDGELLPADSVKFANSNRLEFVPPEIPGSHSVRLIVANDTTAALNFTLNDVREIETVIIPAGNFEMGSNNGLGDEKPVHRVTLSHAFEMSRFEISQAVYKDVISANPSLEDNENLPVYNVNFIDAINFCNALSEKQNLSACYSITGNEVEFNEKANGWRLPTEAEWEYACRAGGADQDDLLGEFAWYVGNSGLALHTPGKLTANSFGLYDMLGNVWEWCYGDIYEYTAESEIDPVHVTTGVETKILRGGAFNSGNIFCRITNRMQPEDKTFSGIRIVKNK